MSRVAQRNVAKKAQFKAITDTANKKPIMQLVSKPDAAEVLGAAASLAGLAT